MDSSGRITLPTCETVLQLATEEQVHAFDLSEIFRIAIGRHHSNDIQIRSKRVSNYHAEILNEVDGLLLRDLGSTNGTYVNNQSVRRQRLTPGDRIRIGSYQLTVHLVPRNAEPAEDSDDNPFKVGTVGNLLSALGGAASPSPRADQLDVTLPELLTRLCVLGSSVVVSIRKTSELGRIFLKDGIVQHCEAGSVRKEKALYRLLGLSKATYELLALPKNNVPQTIAMATDGLIIEGMQQLETMDKISAKLPPPVLELPLNEECAKPIKELSPAEIQVYQDLIRYRTIARVLDESQLTDFTVLKLIYDLLHKGYFQSTGASGMLLEETAYARPPTG